MVSVVVLMQRSGEVGAAAEELKTNLELAAADGMWTSLEQADREISAKAKEYAGSNDPEIERLRDRLHAQFDLKEVKSVLLEADPVAAAEREIANLDSDYRQALASFREVRQTPIPGLADPARASNLEVGEQYRLGILLTMHALARASRDLPKALDELSFAYAIGGDLALSPTMANFQLAFSLQGDVMRVLSQLLESNAQDRTKRSLIRGAVRQLDLPPDLKPAINIGMLDGIEAIKTRKPVPLPLTPTLTQIPKFPYDKVTDEMLRAYQSRWVAFHRSLFTGLKQDRNLVNVRHAFLRDEDRKIRRGRGESFDILRVYSPPYAYLELICGRVLAFQGLIEAYCRVLDQHEQSGQWPEFRELAGLPRDPFTNRNFRYRPIPGGFQIWSVDIDLTNQRGKNRPVTNDALERLDLTLTFVK